MHDEAQVRHHQVLGGIEVFVVAQATGQGLLSSTVSTGTRLTR
jgi:hypothetical protein